MEKIRFDVEKLPELDTEVADGRLGQAAGSRRQVCLGVAAGIAIYAAW